MALQQIIKKFFPWLVLGISLLFSIFYAQPILLAFLTALCFNPLIHKYEKQWDKSRRFIVIVLFSIFSIVVIILCYLLYVFILLKFSELSLWIPQLVDTMNERWINFQSKLMNLTHDLPRPIILSIQQWIEQMLSSLQKVVTTYFQADRLLSFLQRVPMAVFKLFIYFLALYYSMLELPGIMKSFNRWLRIENNPNAKTFVQHFKKSTLEFLKAQLIVSIVIFCVTIVTLLWITPRFAFPMSILVWFVDLLPMLGGMMVLIPWAIICWISGQTFDGTILLILAVIVILLRQILETRVTSEHLGQPPLITLICMYVGFQMFGFIGFLIGPLVAILVVVIGQLRKSWVYVNKKD